jgi:hypothetical protein
MPLFCGSMGHAGPFVSCTGAARVAVGPGWPGTLDARVRFRSAPAALDLDGIVMREVLAFAASEVPMLGIGMVLLGLATFAAMFGFVALCERV